MPKRTFTYEWSVTSVNIGLAIIMRSPKPVGTAILRLESEKLLRGNLNEAYRLGRTSPQEGLGS